MAISMSTTVEGEHFFCHPPTKQRLTGNYLESLASSRNLALLEMNPIIGCAM